MSDHIDGPRSIGDPAADLTDRFRLFAEMHPCLPEYTGRNTPISEPAHNLQKPAIASAPAARLRGGRGCRRVCGDRAAARGLGGRRLPAGARA